MTTYTSGECSITPRSSSGYYEEDDGSNVSDGSYGAAGQFSMASASNPATHQRTESNTTLTNGQLASYQVVSELVQLYNTVIFFLSQRGTM